jgi:hypothetical protein
VTTITQNVTDIAGVDDNSAWIFYTKDIRESDSGDAIVTTKKVRKYPVSGVLTVTLDPGPAAVTAPDGKTYAFTVPTTNSELWPLIQASVAIPPATTAQQIDAAVADYFQAHPPVLEWEQYANLAAFPGTGETAKEYLAQDTGKIYRWTGSAYSEVSAGISPTVVDAKGDLLVGTADNTVARKAVGANGTVLSADSSQSDGLKWVTVKTVITPEQYGAVGNGSTSDQTALQNALNALDKNTALFIDPTKAYAHNAVLTLTTSGGTIFGGGEIRATTQAASAFYIQGNHVTVDNVKFTCPTTTNRGFGFDDHKLVVQGTVGTRLRNVRVDGSHGVGIFVYGSSYFHIETPTVANTRADGINVSGGSHHGFISSPRTEDTGDDGLAVMSVDGDSATCSDIFIHDFAVRNSAARGITLLGGDRITYHSGRIDGAAAAAIYVSCETSILGRNVNDGVIASVDISNANTGAPTIDQGAILVYNDRGATHNIDKVTIRDIAVRNMGATASRRIGLLNMSAGAMTNIALGRITFTGTAPATVLQTSGTITYTTDPFLRGGGISDANNNTILGLFPTASAVNYIGLQNQAAGSTPSVYGLGSDPNVGINLIPQGNESVRIYAGTGQTPTLQGYGADSNHNLNLKSWGTGLVLANSLPVLAEQFITLTSTYTLTSQTAAQKLFNSSTNGRVTLPVGVHFFECVFDLSSMSASSGAFGWDLVAGTATIAGIKWWSTANKAALATAAAPQTTVNTAANTAIVTATTNTVGWARITGKVRISAAGTVIPSVSLGVAAAAVVGVDSYFRIWQVASSATAVTAGTWS